MLCIGKTEYIPEWRLVEKVDPTGHFQLTQSSYESIWGAVPVQQSCKRVACLV